MTPPSTPYYAYLVRCADDSLYAGITTDLARRLAEHNGADAVASRGAKYTRARRPVELVYAARFPDRSSASKEEARVKSLSREEKIALVDGVPTVRRSTRAKNVSVTVYGDGRVVVTAPPHASDALVKRFVESRADWVRRKRRSFMPFLQVAPRKRGPSKAERRRAFDTHKEWALGVVSEALERFRPLYGFTWGTVTIRDQKSRWGSCSARGDLSFSWRVATLPPRLADYLVVHELCHRGEFNHSPRFWALVGRAIPDYRERREELKRLSLRTVVG